MLRPDLVFLCSLLKPNVKVHPWRVLWSCLGCWGQLSHHRRVKHVLLLSQPRNLPLFRLSMWLPVLSHDTITIINRSSIKNMIKYNIYSLSNYATCPSLVLGMSTIMRKPMLMGGAAIPGWGLNLSDYLIFFQISLSLPENLSGVICLVLFFLGGSFFIDLPPRCHTLWSSPQVEKLFSVASLVTRREIMPVREQCLTK